MYIAFRRSQANQNLEICILSRFSSTTLRLSIFTSPLHSVLRAGMQILEFALMENITLCCSGVLRDLTSSAS
jgi:hypothetical protein